MKQKTKVLQKSAALLLAGLVASPAFGSSHMDAPLITLDPAANTADVYAFRSDENGNKYLTAAVTVYPFEEPGIGPNKYNFDDNVLYEIHVAVGNDLAKGKATISYQFEFETTYKTKGTILQSYIGVVNEVGDAAQNLVQNYKVTKVEHRKDNKGTLLGKGVVPPNNQGIATPKYNQGDNGENPAKEGVATLAALDPYTVQSIAELKSGYKAFAGQRDDGFYGDIQAVFDLLQLRSPAKDAQGGFNVHSIVLRIPLDELGGASQVAGIYATTSRRKISILREDETTTSGDWVQVGRQGNPLFCEAFVAIADKDLYNRSSPENDKKRFTKYALNPELAGLINAILFSGSKVAPETNRTDLAGIFIPDLIKIDLSTGPAKLAGGGTNSLTNPDDMGFSRLSIFGNDVLTSTIQDGFGGGVIPGGWPNGRRFGDDVVDIGVTAVLSDLRTSPPKVVGPAGDNVDHNDIAYSKVFPYAATPHNGRTHPHHGETP